MHAQDRIIERDIVGGGDRWIPEDEYRLILDRVPIVCADVLLTREVDAVPSVGLILRRTTDNRVGWCLVGGAVLRDEPLTKAVSRHVAATLGRGAAVRAGTLRNTGVFEYFTQAGIGDLVDPRKHAVAIAFTAELDGEPVADGWEALEFQWFPLQELPPNSAFGFGQDLVVRHILSTL